MYIGGVCVPHGVHVSCFQISEALCRSCDNAFPVDLVLAPQLGVLGRVATQPY
jgi:hypothetical protein